MTNKLPMEMENPVDIQLTHLSEKTIGWMYETGHVPNTITTYSFLCSLLSSFLLLRGYIMGFLVFRWLGYFFDCADGQLARIRTSSWIMTVAHRYNMVSTTGDYYDHFTTTMFDVYHASCCDVSGEIVFRSFISSQRMT